MWVRVRESPRQTLLIVQRLPMRQEASALLDRAPMYAAMLVTKCQFLLAQQKGPMTSRNSHTLVLNTTSGLTPLAQRSLTGRRQLGHAMHGTK